MNDAITFIERWRASGASERANYQLFLSELCDLLGVPHPDPASDTTADNAYCFERVVWSRAGERPVPNYEEARGLVRYLRPAYQAPDGGEQQALAVKAKVTKKKAKRPPKRPWPKSLAERAQALQEVLQSLERPERPEDLVRRFKRAQADQVMVILETLQTLGLAHHTDEGEVFA